MLQPRSRIGFRHQFAADDDSTPNLDAWLADLTELEAGWLCLPASAQRMLPETFVRGMLEAGVQPLIHIPVSVGSVSAAELAPLLHSYGQWGVRYVVVYDRPNLKQSWAKNGWSRSGLVDRFLDAMLPLLQAQLSAGMVPILPPLEPGGDYWDLAFLESALKGLARRAQRELTESLALAVDARTQGKPLDWGAGGAQRWPQARAYSTPAESQDHLGFRIFEWYTEIIARTLGGPRPLLALTAGATAEEEQSGETNQRLARWLRQQPAEAEQLISVCFDSLPTTAERSSWLRSEAACSRQRAKSAPGAEGKSLTHYLLLPADEAQAVKAWRHASAFALTHRPVVGFSSVEAALADIVTIAGGPEAVPASIDDELRQAGCRVQRLTLLPQRKSECQRKTPNREPEAATVS